jgi:type I restriction enzyme S subunit
MNLPKLPKTWIWSRLSIEVYIRDEKVDPGKEPEKEFFYVGLEDIESNTGQLTSKELPTTKGSEIKSLKNRFYKGDILYGRLRPALNKVYFAQEDGICSTDIWVLQTQENLDPEYLYYYLKTPLVCEKLSQSALGGQLPRVPRDALSRVYIPIPTIPEQQHIVKILKQSDVLYSECSELIDQAKNLSPALFLEIFGNPNQWSEHVTKLGGIAILVTSGSRDWSQYYSSSPEDAKFIRVQNIKAGELDLSDMAYVIAPENTEAERAKVQTGDLLISITGTVGQVATAPECLGEAYISQHIALVRTNGSLPIDYLVEYLNHPIGGHLQVQRANYGQTKPGLNLQQIKELVIPLFNTNKITKFLIARDELKNCKHDLEESLSSFMVLNEALMQEAFSGKLTSDWREKHHEELEAWLHKYAQHAPTKLVHISDQKITSSEILSPIRSTRRWVMGQLSNIQNQVYSALTEWKGFLIPSEDLDRFLGEWLIESLEDSYLEDIHDHVLRALNQLSELGLIARVGVPNRMGEYITGYCILREEELTKVSDLTRLRALS